VALIYWGQVSAASDITMAAVVNQSASETRAAILSLIGPVAADIIANDSTIRDAATIAVANELEDLDVVLHTDPGAPRTVPDWTHNGKVVKQFTMDNSNRVPWILYVDGTFYPPLGGDSGGGSSTAVTGVDARGDSMTAAFNGGGTAYPETMAGLITVPVDNNGITGYTSTEIATAANALDVYVSAASDSIPASGPVTVTVTPTGTWRAGYARNFPGSLAGVDGTLSKSTSEVWTFTRTTYGSAVALPKETLFRAGARSVGRKARIWWAGRNNPTSSTVRRDALAAATEAAMRNAPFLCLSLFNAQNEPEGSGEYNAIIARNAELAADHGPNYYDLRGWMIRNGLDAAGKTPTSADLTAISEDRIPPSLMSDVLHLNADGYRIVGQRLAALTTSKGWYES
jgi:hypothetical protein